MTKNNIKKKIISFFMALAMVLTLLPVQSMTVKAETYRFDSDSTSMISVGSEKIPVAVYATDGSDSFDKNTDLMEILGLGYVQDDHYAPIGVIYLDSSFFYKKKSPYIKSQEDLDAVISAISEIDTNALNPNKDAYKNKDNKVASMLEYVSTDLNQSAGSLCTALFDFESTEKDDSILLNGKIATQNNHFKYHLDLRFKTSTLTIKNASTSKVIGTRVYLTGTNTIDPANSKDWYITVPNGSAITGYYTDQRCNNPYNFGTPLNQDTTIYVKIEKKQFNVTYKLNGGSIGNITADVVKNNVAYGSAAPCQAEPTKTDCIFTGWLASDTGKVYTTNELATRYITGDVTFTAQWKAVDKNYTVITKLQQADGTYAENSVTKSAPAGETVEITPEVKDGYRLDTAASTLSGINDGSLELTLVYKSTNIPYTVNYYQQNTTGDVYTLVLSETKYGAEGDTASITPNADKYTGFTLNSSKSKASGTITTGRAGQLSLNVYYDRNTYTISYIYTGSVPEGATSLLPEDETVRYGARHTIAGNVAVAGYTFTGWSTTSDIAIDGNNFTMPASDVSFTGSFNANGNTQYTVEYYTEKLGADGEYDTYKTTACTGTTGATISVSPENITGFTFDPEKSAGYDSKTIKGDGTTVVKLYYSRNTYEVTISYPAEPGQQPTAETKTYQYGQTLEAINKPSADGYDFNTSTNWPDEDTTVTGPMTITGSWTAKEVNYTVEYYGQNADGEGYTVIDAENPTAYTGTEVELTDIPEEQGNYTYDADNANNVTEATVAGDGTTVLKVYYKRNTYTVTYKVTGTDGSDSTYSTNTYKWGESFTLVDAPNTIEGYTFQGWNVPEDMTQSGDSYTMPTKDIVITGYYSANEGTAYKIEYYTEDLVTKADGSAKYSKVNRLTRNLTGTTDTTVTTDNYEQDITGFTLDKNISGTVASAKIAGDGSTTLKLYYSRNTYKVSYNIAGTEETIESSNVKYGAALDNLKNPTVAAGYSFSGYKYNNGDLPATMPAEDITLTGEITANTNTNVTVKYYFETLDGDYKEAATQAVQKTITATTDTLVYPVDNKLSEDPTGFYYDADKSENVRGTNVDGDGNAVLKVYYSRHEYTVRYSYSNIVAGAATLPTNETYKYGATVTVAEDATAPGYNFSWDRTDSFKMPAEDVNIRGTFTASGNSSYTTEYYFEGLDGQYVIDARESTTTQNVRAGETANAVEKTFTGFTLNRLAEGTVASGRILGNDSLVLKLYYSRNTYSLTIKNEEGEVIDKKDVKYGDNIPTVAAPEKAGYNFNKWVDANGADLPETMSEDITIKPNYTAGTSGYKIEYYKQNLEDNDYTLADIVDKTATTDSDITAEEAPAGKDYTYYTKVTTADSIETGTATGNGNTVLKVYYNRNTYKITYNYSGIIPAGFNSAATTTSYKYGSKVTIATYPTVEGYTFNGWGYDGLAIESIDRDYTLTGSFTANGDTEYKVHYYIEDLVYDENGNYIGDKYTKYKTITYTGQTDTSATAAEITIPGFTLDSNNSANVTTGNIDGDGSRELSLYYKRNLHTVTIHYNTAGGKKLTEDIKLSVPYGGLFTINTPAIEGYTPDYKSVSNPEGGMIDADIAIAVTYTANPVATVDAGSGNGGGQAVAVSTNEIVQPTATAATVPYTTAAVVTATGATVVTANPEAMVEDEEVPEAKLTTTEDGDTELLAIESDETPLAVEEAAANPWALINLLSMLITAIMAIYLLIKAFRKKDQDEEQKSEDKKDSKKNICLGGLIPAIVAIIAFFLTENIKNPMAFIDKWTILMIILLAIEALLAYLARNKKENSENR